MKRNLLTTYLICLLWLGGQSAVFALNTPPTTPLWAARAFLVFSGTEIGVFWKSSTDSAGLSGYYIYRCMGASCTLPSQPTFNINSPTATFYADATLSPGTTYRYAIAAYDTLGNISAQSAIISATTSGTLSSIVPVIGLVSPANGAGPAGQNFSFNMDQSNLGAGGLINGNSNYNWDWNFGDGTTQTGQSPVVHVYSKPGAYTLTLSVYNTATGDQAAVQQTVTVLPVVSIANATLRLPFNGDIVDYSGNQLQTQGVGGIPSFTTGTPCVVGLSSTLDGTANGPYVSVTDNGSGLLDGNSPASLALFVQKNVASAAGTVYVKQGVYSLAIAAQGVSATLTNSVGATANLSSSTVANNDTNWHHYAVTYDGTTAILYFDGVVVASQTLGGNLAHVPASNLLLGKTIAGNTFNGLLNTVRFYNAALTPAQVAYLYNGSQYGDVNGVLDTNGYGVVGVYDAYLTIQEVVGSQNFTSTQSSQAEVSGDASPSAYDASLIAEKSINSILKFPQDISEE